MTTAQFGAIAGFSTPSQGRVGRLGVGVVAQRGDYDWRSRE